MSEQSVSSIQKAWRQAPLGLRLGVNRCVTNMAQRFGQMRGQLERGGPPSTDVCVMGLHRAVLGLGRGARLFYTALDGMNLNASAWDVSELLGDDLTLPSPATEIAHAATVVSHLNPIEHLHALALSKGPRPKRGLRIGFWAWETSQMPDDWIKGIAAVDEVWCPSVFTADSARKLIGDRCPIRVVSYPIPASLAGLSDKARFGFPSDKVTFFSACDLRSSLDRKNPLGAIEAFRRSGSGVRGEANLLVKVHGDFEGSGLNELKLAASKVSGVTVLDKKLSVDDMKSLRSSIDVVLSPHRSEGFGLVLAEAMRAGKPVIATGWSGNMDFMDEDCAALVGSKEVPVADSAGFYRTGTWAEPDLDHAASHIARLASNEGERTRLGNAGHQRICDFADRQRWQSTVRSYLRLPAIG